MSETILQNQTVIRLGFFFGLLTLVGLWEILAPRRALTVSKAVRWVNNLGMVFFYSWLVRLIFPLAAVGMAELAASRSWGLLNLYPLPAWVAIPLAVIVLDLVIYLQHVMVHAVPLFWRLHRMHHADLDYDVTTGARFHPLEIILSMGIKLAAVALIGAPPVAVVIFEVVLNGMAMFNHGNIRLPLGLDSLLRLLVVTPDMHRVHHSIRPGETNSNFGFNLSLWDRFFGTYRAQPADGHEGMTIGIREFREPRYLWFHLLLLQPFLKNEGAYPLGRTGNEGTPHQNK